MLKNFIFDWSGTIQDDVKIFFEVTNRMFKKLGKPEGISIEEIEKNFTVPHMKFWNMYFPDLTGEEEMSLFQEVIKTITPPGLVEGIKPVLEDLKENDKKLYIMSADPPSKINSEIKTGRLDDLFEDIVSNPEDKIIGIRKILENNNLKASESIYFGDTSGDVEAARELGLKTAAVSWGIQKDELVKKSQPDYFFNKPQDIQKEFINA